MICNFLKGNYRMWLQHCDSDGLMFNLRFLLSKFPSNPESLSTNEILIMTVDRIIYSIAFKRRPPCGHIKF